MNPHTHTHGQPKLDSVSLKLNKKKFFLKEDMKLGIEGVLREREDGVRSGYDQDPVFVCMRFSRNKIKVLKKYNQTPNTVYTLLIILWQDFALFKSFIMHSCAMPFHSKWLFNINHSKDTFCLAIQQQI